VALLLGVEGGGASSVASAWDSLLVEMFSSLRVDGKAAAAAYRASETLYAGSRARRFYAP